MLLIAKFQSSKTSCSHLNPLCVLAERAVRSCDITIDDYFGWMNNLHSPIDFWFKQKKYSRQTKDTMNYCVLINKLLELMGDEFIQL